MRIEDDERSAAQAIEAGAFEDALRLLQPLAERNSEYALLTLGWIYETGPTRASDKAAAKLCYQDAAALGSAIAYLYLGRLFMGEGNEMQARDAFESGADLGNEECRAALERFSCNRVEQLAAQAMEADAHEEAFRLLKPLAELNSEYALLTIGWLYETGAIGTCDKGAAQQYYQRAAANGSGLGHLYLGRLFLSEGEEMQAHAAFEAGAQLGDEDCKSTLQRRYDADLEKLATQAIDTGAYEEAARLLNYLAVRNSPYALLALGWMYETGATGAPDMRAAHSFYGRAAAEGSVSAYLGLGRVHVAEGEKSQALAAFETGAELGNISCMYRLGRMIVEGSSNPSDVAKGIAWLKRAAALGHLFSKRRLLEIELHNANSIFERLRVRVRIVFLAVKGATEALKDPGSDIMR